MKLQKPTVEALKAAENKLLPDLVAEGLEVLFCGINPSLYSAALGYHFARPGNRFWPALYAGGFTPRLLQPQEQQELLYLGCGITNVASRPTTAAASLNAAEIKEGAERLREKILLYKPKVLAVLGITVYKEAFGAAEVKVGLQEEMMAESRVWVLPNPSGLNAHYTPATLGELFTELRTFTRHFS